MGVAFIYSRARCYMRQMQSGNEKRVSLKAHSRCWKTTRNPELRAVTFAPCPQGAVWTTSSSGNFQVKLGVNKDSFKTNSDQDSSGVWKQGEPFILLTLSTAGQATGLLLRHSRGSYRPNGRPTVILQFCDNQSISSLKRLLGRYQY